MKKTNFYLTSLAFVALFTFGCENAEKESTEVAVDQIAATQATDMGVIKAEIQTLENAWAEAQNTGNVDGLMAMYADDAVSMGDNKPAVMGKEALRKDMEENIASKPKGNMISFETTDVFGNDNQVTETGISTTKDASGKVIETGKYMAIWEKRNGKYVCIRDIYNLDAPAK